MLLKLAGIGAGLTAALGAMIMAPNAAHADGGVLGTGGPLGGAAQTVNGLLEPPVPTDTTATEPSGDLLQDTIETAAPIVDEVLTPITEATTLPPPETPITPAAPANEAPRAILDQAVGPVTDAIPAVFDEHIPVPGELPRGGESIEPALNPLTVATSNLAGPVAEAATPLTGSLVETTLEPVGQIVETTLAPLNPALDNVVRTTVEPLEPVIGTLVDTTLEPVLPVADTVVGPLAPVIEGVVEPVLEPLQPVITNVLEPVIEPVVPVVDGVLDPVLGPLEPAIGELLPPGTAVDLGSHLPSPGAALAPTGAQPATPGAPVGPRQPVAWTPGLEPKSTAHHGGEVPAPVASYPVYPQHGVPGEPSPVPSNVLPPVTAETAGSRSAAVARPAQRLVPMTPDMAAATIDTLVHPSQSGVARSSGGMNVPPGMFAPASLLGIASGSVGGPTTVGEKLAAVLGLMAVVSLLNLSWRARIAATMPASCSYAPAVGPD